MNDLNYLALIIGPPQYGKTTIAQQIAVAKLREGWWVFAHDPAWQYRMCQHWRTAADWSNANRAAAASKRPFPRGASFECGAGEMTELAIRVGRRNRAGSVRLPILAIYDESSLLEKSSGSYISPGDNQLIATRRHKGIGLVYLLQWPTQLHPAFLNVATDVYLFRQPPQHLPMLEERLHLRKGELAALGDAPKFKFLHVRLGDGIVRSDGRAA